MKHRIAQGETKEILEMESLAFDDQRDDASACSSNPRARARARAAAGRIDHPILFASRIIARSKNNSASVNARLLLLRLRTARRDWTLYQARQLRP